MISYILLVCCVLTHLESTVQKPAIDPYAKDSEPSLESEELQAVAYEEVLVDVLKAILPKVSKSRKVIDINSWLRKLTNKVIFQALHQEQEENAGLDTLRTTVDKLERVPNHDCSSRGTSTNIPERPYNVENHSLDSMFQNETSDLNSPRVEHYSNTSSFGGTSVNKTSISRNGGSTDVTELLTKNQEENYVGTSSSLHETLVSQSPVFQKTVKSVSTDLGNTVTSNENEVSNTTTPTKHPPSDYGVSKPIINNGATELNDNLIAATSTSAGTSATAYVFTSNDQSVSESSSLFSHYSILTPPESESKGSPTSPSKLPHSDIDFSTILPTLSDALISSGSTAHIENLHASKAVTGPGMPSAVTHAEIYSTLTSPASISAVTTDTSSATTLQNYHSLSHSVDENSISFTSVTDSTVNSFTDDDTVNINKETLSSRSPADTIETLPHNEEATTTEGILQSGESLEPPAESSNKSFHSGRESFTGKPFSGIVTETEQSANWLSVGALLESVINPSLLLDGRPASNTLNLASSFKEDLIDTLSNIIHDSILKVVHNRSNYDKNSPLIHYNSNVSTPLLESSSPMNSLTSVPRQNDSTVTTFEPSDSFSRILYILSKYVSEYVDKYTSFSVTDRFRGTNLSSLQHDRNNLRNSLVEHVMSSLANTSFAISSKKRYNFANLSENRDIRQDSELRGGLDLQFLSLRGFSSLKDLADDITGCFLNTLSRHIQISKSFMQNYFKSNIPAVTDISERCTHTTPLSEERDKSPDPSSSVSVGTEVLPCSSNSHVPPTIELEGIFNTLVKELSRTLRGSESTTPESFQSTTYSNSKITPPVRDDMKSNFDKVSSYLISGLLNDTRELDNALNDSRKFSYSLFQRISKFLSIDPYASSMIRSLADSIANHFAKGAAEPHGQSNIATSSATPKAKETGRLNNPHSKSPLIEVTSSDFTTSAKMRTNNSEYLSSTESPKLNYSLETSHYSESSDENDCEELGDETESVEDNSHSYSKTLLTSSIFPDYNSSRELNSTMSGYSHSTESTESNTEVSTSSLNYLRETSSSFEFLNESITDVSTGGTEYIDPSEEGNALQNNIRQPERQTQSKSNLTECITTSEILANTDSVHLSSVESYKSESKVSKALNNLYDSYSSESSNERDYDSDEGNATESTDVTQAESDIGRSSSMNSTAITSNSYLLSNRCDKKPSAGRCGELVGNSDESNSNLVIEKEIHLEFEKGSSEEDRNRAFEVVKDGAIVQFNHSSSGSLDNKSELNFLYKIDKREESTSKDRVNFHKSEGSLSDTRILPYPKYLSTSEQETNKELVNEPLLKYYYTKYGYPYNK